MVMSKTGKSFSIHSRLAEIIDEMPGKNSDLVNEALKSYLVTDHDSLEKSISSLEKKREKKRIEKQQIEQDIWELDDRIERLRDLRTETKSVEKVKDEVGLDRIMQVSNIVKQNKYDSDPRSDSEQELIEKHTDMILKETGADFNREEVEKTLKTYVNV